MYQMFNMLYVISVNFSRILSLWLEKKYLKFWKNTHAFVETDVRNIKLYFGTFKTEKHVKIK